MGAARAFNHAHAVEHAAMVTVASKVLNMEKAP